MATAKSGTTKTAKASATAETRKTAPAGKKTVAARPADKKPADKKPVAKQPVAKKAEARKSVAGATSSARDPGGDRSASSKASAQDVGSKQAPKPTRAKPEKTPGEAGRITPQQALANTRALLEAKKGHARQPQPWQKLDQQAGPADKAGYQSPEAADKAEQLHEGESRMQAIQGSISSTDRTNQGKRDAR